MKCLERLFKSGHAVAAADVDYQFAGRLCIVELVEWFQSRRT